MYQITDEDKHVLFRIDPLDSIQRLTILKPETLSILENHDIALVDDMPKNDKLFETQIDGIDEDEMIKLRTIYNYLFYGNVPA